MTLTKLLSLLQSKGMALSLSGDDLSVRGIEDALSDRELIASLLQSGRYEEAIYVLPRADEHIPLGPDARWRLGADLWDIVYKTPQIPRETARIVLTLADAALDQALKARPDYREALVYKSLVLRAQAERVEQDLQKSIALMAEADRLRDRAAALRDATR